MSALVTVQRYQACPTTPNTSQSFPQRKLRSHDLFTGSDHYDCTIGSTCIETGPIIAHIFATINNVRAFPVTLILSYIKNLVRAETVSKNIVRNLVEDREFSS